MTYKRKTIDTFEIQGDCGQGWEMMTTELTRREAREQIKLYREADTRIPYRIKLVRERINATP